MLNGNQLTVKKGNSVFQFCFSAKHTVHTSSLRKQCWFFLRVHFFIRLFLRWQLQSYHFLTQKYPFESSERFRQWGSLTSPCSSSASPVFEGLQDATHSGNTAPTLIQGALCAGAKTKHLMCFWHDPLLFSFRSSPLTPDSSLVSHSHCLENTEQIWGARESDNKRWLGCLGLLEVTEVFRLDWVLGLVPVVFLVDGSSRLLESGY